MPEIGRFTGVDPIAEDYPHVSVYNYAENSPIGNIDLWGLQRVDVMKPDKDGVVPPTHTLGTTTYQGRDVTKPPQYNGYQPSISPAPQATLDPVASTVGKQLVTSAPAVLDEIAELPMLGIYTLKGMISGNWNDAKYQAIGVLLPGISKTTIKTLTGFIPNYAVEILVDKSSGKSQSPANHFLRFLTRDILSLSVLFIFSK